MPELPPEDDPDEPDEPLALLEPELPPDEAAALDVPVEAELLVSAFAVELDSPPLFFGIDE